MASIQSGGREREAIGTGGSSQQDTQEQVLFSLEIFCQSESWPKLGLQAALPLKIPRGEKDEEEIGNARTHARATEMAK